jgi:adenosylcobinamide-GDP ribazoletransferase
MRGLLAAIQFLTRLPVPGFRMASEAEVAASAGFFPAVGLLVGAGGILLYYGLKHFLPPSTCVLLVLVYSAVVTNAMHEDGLADSIDGFGAGWTREQTLKIMRDSRIGTFGTLALVFLVLGKYNLLSALEWPQFWRWFLFANAASRWSMLPLCILLDYAREEGQGKLVARRVSLTAVLIGTLTIAITASLVFPLQTGLAAIAVAGAVSLITGLYYNHRLAGITGDCLGATSEFTELALYLAAVLLAGRT